MILFPLLGPQDLHPEATQNAGSWDTATETRKKTGFFNVMHLVVYVSSRVLAPPSNKLRFF